ncbi:MAG: hypothetical protein CVV22_08595 [Ignavibacteriae bacterium HGW-Ignavibacteriae-1]|jgi:hypothetical protein|nr:MAG: hypothetical protein CVV22_08595 [Ignavibacteriae bacterium HGW-Ignavibacteriae-1]
MKIASKIFDKRINALNVQIEITYVDYLKIAKNIIKSNEFQRRRVKSSSTIYSLLKSDLKTGCIIPPIVLAISNIPTDIISQNATDTEIISNIEKHQSNLLILDGLQRTHTIIDAEKELVSDDDSVILENFYNRFLRIEVYIGINKLGILYRMLTLNTGQTPMSVRHQIEILFSDYLTNSIDDIKLYTEKDDKTPRKKGEYNFRDIIDGFNSYLERNELPIERSHLLDNIKSLEKLSKEQPDSDLFNKYLTTYHKLVEKFEELSENYVFNAETIEYIFSAGPFATNAIKLINKSQTMTGFGSAIGRLYDLEVINGITEVNDLIDVLKVENPKDAFDEILIYLDRIRVHAKKIGNDQRLYFHFFFRELFDKKGDSYLNINSAVNEAYHSYERKTK